MKRLACISIVAACIITGLSLGVVAEAWWELAPPMITSPAPNEQFAVNESITYSWALPWGTPAELISHYELQFANGAPYTGNLFAPDAGGGVCEWDAIRVIESTAFVTNHQGTHEPIYFRVRAVFTGGQETNWGYSYHRVGDYPDEPSPPTIIAPLKIKFDCNPAVYHEWTPVEGADGYEFAFAQSFCNTANLLENCVLDVRAPVTYTSFTGKHDCIHLPIYFLVRAIFEDGSKSNWAITYYYMTKNCILCGNCGYVGTEESTWGKIKNMHK